MKVLVTGGRGMLGCHIQDKLWTTSHEGVFVGSNDYNLTSQFQVRKMFEEIMPDAVIHAAARVGGIQENIDQTSGKQRKMIISLTSKGVHWFAMGAMTIVGPCFKLLRCCGVRKTKLSEFAKDYLGADGEFEVPE